MNQKDYHRDGKLSKAALAMLFKDVEWRNAIRAQNVPEKLECCTSTLLPVRVHRLSETSMMNLGMNLIENTISATL